MNDDGSHLLRMQAKHLSFLTSAEECGGNVVSTFNQCLGGVSALIGMDPATRRGACQALSARWIADHAAGGSLWNAMYTAAGHVSIAVVKEVMAEQKAFGKMGLSGLGVSGRDLQEWNTERYLFRRGVARRLDVNTGNRLLAADTTALGGNPWVCHTLTDQFAAGMPDVYKLIAIKGTNGGHCMAAWVGANNTGGREIAFFDPNVGEIWFPTLDGFRKWFAKFWMAAYSKSYGGYHIRDYGRKLSHVTKMAGKKKGPI